MRSYDQKKNAKRSKEEREVNRKEERNEFSKDVMDKMCIHVKSKKQKTEKK